MKFNETLKGTLVGVKGHFTRAYSQPIFDKKYLVRSYNAYKLRCAYASNIKDKTQYDYEKRIWDVSHVTNLKNNTIGIATGNFLIDEHKKIWLEMKPLFCNRAETVYVRADDTDIKIKNSVKQNSGKLLNTLLMGLAVYEILN